MNYMLENAVEERKMTILKHYISDLCICMPYEILALIIPMLLLENI